MMTSNHTYVNFANPFLVCDTCRQPAIGYHSPSVCHCHTRGWSNWWNVPCEHNDGVHSVCPTWGPVDGCQCLNRLGYVPHPPASEVGND